MATKFVDLAHSPDTSGRLRPSGARHVDEHGGPAAPPTTSTARISARATGLTVPCESLRQSADNGAHEEPTHRDRLRAAANRSATIQLGLRATRWRRTSATGYVERDAFLFDAPVPFPSWFDQSVVERGLLTGQVRYGPALTGRCCVAGSEDALNQAGSAVQIALANSVNAAATRFAGATSMASS
jgi:hypothetical protein